ncbi:chain length determinant protein tyrosine kinase EpsG [Rhodoferax sp. TS-BS-61-7]|uniref:chain length determinant protein tyrosine kinase EpsG n=1 Tax=Rhodoferax sp. TS-BS-61-7 TaxID=2094194 RepID=UPI000CF6A0BB|nr:chain length determinant protein tyrosine kinase EpsG [Rhodoferax sp. TS-BS-61-7]PQA77451.1 chain length determinant protein tyrosine kinase EpsG [Rhodoferax sp. TS-BS-61-7]
MNQVRTIGDILVATGRLSQDDAARIVERQHADKVQFGDAALALKVLTKDDIDFALSKQFDYAYLSDQDDSVSHELVAAYKPFSRVGENLRAVRSQLMLRWFNTDPAHKVIAIVSPGSGEGRSFIAANLAIVFAQQGERTLLIDADLRAKPARAQNALFKLGKSAGLSGILANRAGLEVAQLVPGLPGLAVLPAGATPPNPQELLGRPAFGDLLRIASQQFDVIIIDTPAGTEFADAEVTAARAGAALLVARKNKSLVPQANQLARRLQDSGVALVGSVLNDA